MNKTVAIVGTHPDTRDDAPFDDPRVDIWLFNEVANQKLQNKNGDLQSWAGRADAVFQMHKPSIYRSLHNRADPGHWTWLQEWHKFPIYMLNVDSRVPSSKKYPLDKVMHLLNSFTMGSDKKPVKFSTSGVSYAFALAAYKEQYKEILIYGVEMGSNTEYVYQRECIAFWAGVLAGMGKTLNWRSSGDIFDKPLYGYDGRIEQTPEEFSERIEELEVMATELRARRSKANEALHTAYRKDKLPDYITEAGDAASQLGEVDGALHESMRYHYQIQDMWANEGSAYIDRNEFEGKAGSVKDELEKNTKAVFTPVLLIDYLMKMWRDTQDPRALNQLKLFIGQHINAAYKAGFSRGVWQENFNLAQKWDELVRMAGGEGALAAIGLPEKDK